jgi:hypothetical protein
MAQMQHIEGIFICYATLRAFKTRPVKINSSAKLGIFIITKPIRTKEFEASQLKTDLLSFRCFFAQIRIHVVQLRLSKLNL